MVLASEADWGCARMEAVSDTKQPIAERCGDVYWRETAAATTTATAPAILSMAKSCTQR